MTSPLATPAMAALRQRLAKPTPRTIAETIRRKDPTPMPAPSTTPASSGKVDRRLDSNRSKTPHTIHLREFDMADGRKLLIDRRSIAFICEAKPEEHPGKQITVIAFRTNVRACPVACPYETVRAWWYGSTPAGNAKRVGVAAT